MSEHGITPQSDADVLLAEGHELIRQHREKCLQLVAAGRVDSQPVNDDAQQQMTSGTEQSELAKRPTADVETIEAGKSDAAALQGDGAPAAAEA